MESRNLDILIGVGLVLFWFLIIEAAASIFLPVIKLMAEPFGVEIIENSIEAGAYKGLLGLLFAWGTEVIYCIRSRTIKIWFPIGSFIGLILYGIYLSIQSV